MTDWRVYHKPVSSFSALGFFTFLYISCFRIYPDFTLHLLAVSDRFLTISINLLKPNAKFSKSLVIISLLLSICTVWLSIDRERIADAYRIWCIISERLTGGERSRDVPYLIPEVGRVTFKSNGEEVFSVEFLLKSNGDEALNDVFPQK